MNLYEYVRSSPIFGIDPSELHVDYPSKCEKGKKNCPELLAKMNKFASAYNQKVDEWNKDDNKWQSTNRKGHEKDLDTHLNNMVYGYLAALNCWNIYMDECKCEKPYPVGDPTKGMKPIPALPPVPVPPQVDPKSPYVQEGDTFWSYMVRMQMYNELAEMKAMEGAAPLVGGAIVATAGAVVVAELGGRGADAVQQALDQILQLAH